jgi:hypothetical protein
MSEIVANILQLIKKKLFLDHYQKIVSLLLSDPQCVGIDKQLIFSSIMSILKR